MTYNISHPGASATKFGQDEKKGFLTDLIYKVGLKFMITPAEGAKSEIYLAASPEVEGKNGLFISPKCQEDKINEKYYTVENEQKLWDYCMKVCKAYM